MLKKLKQNLSPRGFLKKSLAFLGFLLAIATVGSVFLPSQTVQAQTAGKKITPSEIVVTTETLTQRSGDTFVSDNLIRVGRGEPVRLRVKLTLTSPVAGIAIGRDTLDFQRTGGDPFIISGIGAGIERRGDGNTCENDTIFNIWGSNKNYLSCDFPGNSTALISATQVAAGTAYELAINVNAGALGLNPNNSQPQVFTVYPYILFDQATGPDNTVINAAGKDVYVQYFATSQLAEQARTANTRPDNIPVYASNTGAGQSDPTGGLVVGVLNKIITFILGLINEIMYFLFYYLVAPLIQAMLSIRTYTDTFAGVIYPGWVIVRNICNLFFIVALIVIGLATVFRVESYHFRQMLVQLILAALLVNFSLVIAQAILGIADTIQSQFLPNNVEVIRGLARDLMVTNTRDSLGQGLLEGGTFSNLIQQIFYVSMSVGTFAVFGAIAVFLLIRMVALWLFLLFSPIPYAAGILPATASWRSQWWSGFIKYAFFTPIIAFFLNLAAVISIQQRNNPVLQQITSADFGNSEVAEFVFRVASNIILLVFLIAAIKVADSFGIAGSHAITEIAQKGLWAPFKAAGGLTKAAAGRTFEAVQNKTGITMDPKLWAGAWKQEMERRKHQRLEKRMGSVPLGALGKKLGLEGVPLGSPQDFVANYVSPKGLKRVGKNSKLARLFGGGTSEDYLRKVEIEEEKAKIMTDATRSLLETQRASLAGDMRDITAADVGKDQAGQIKKSLLAKHGELAALSKKLNDEATEARTTGQTETEALKLAEKANADADQARIQAAITDIDAQMNNPATGGRVNLGAYASDAFYKENLFDVEKNRVNDQQVNTTQQALDDDKRRRDVGYRVYADPSHTVVTQGMVDKAKSDIRDFKKKAAERMAPEAYYARQARLHGENDELKKVADIEDVDQLTSLFNNALSQGDAVKAVAVAKKMAQDANFNDLLKNTGYDASYEGMKKFFEEVIQRDLKVDEHEMYQIATEVSYLNEHNKFWNMARMVKVEGSHLHWMSEDEHSKSIAWEARKQHAQNAVRTNPRYAYIDEDPDGNRKFHGGGIELLKSYNISSALKEIPNNFNIASLEAITSVPDWENKLKAAGVPEKVVNAIVQAKGNKIK